MPSVYQRLATKPQDKPCRRTFCCSTRLHVNQVSGWMARSTPGRKAFGIKNGPPSRTARAAVLSPE
jgi:hypothetical protein